MSGIKSPGLVRSVTPIPPDMQLGRAAFALRLKDRLLTMFRDSATEPLGTSDLLGHILHNSDVDLLLKTIGTAFTPRVVTIGTTPTRIIGPNRVPRGFIFSNPAGVPITAWETVLASAARGPATVNSGDIAVANYILGTCYLNITVNAGSVGTLTVAVQGKDPLSGNYRTSQADIFTANNAVGTYRANIGGDGMQDINIRFQCVIGAQAMTFSLSLVKKEGVPGSASAASTNIFLGGADVAVANGYPLLPGNKDTFFLKENVTIYGIASEATNLHVFELQ